MCFSGHAARYGPVHLERSVLASKIGQRATCAERAAPFRGENMPEKVQREEVQREEVQHEEFVGRPSRRKPEEFKDVRFRIEGAASRATLHRPEHNLFTEPILRELAVSIEGPGASAAVYLVPYDSAV